MFKDVSIVMKSSMSEGVTRKEWSVYRPGFGAVAVWAVFTPDAEYPLSKVYGGLEMHYEKPPYYMDGRAPSNDHCTNLLCRPCWHDGSTLQFEERYKEWVQYATDEEMLRSVAFELDSRSGKSDDYD